LASERARLTCCVSTRRGDNLVTKFHISFAIGLSLTTECQETKPDRQAKIKKPKSHCDSAWQSKEVENLIQLSHKWGKAIEQREDDGHGMLDDMALDSMVDMAEDMALNYRKAYDVGQPKGMPKGSYVLPHLSINIDATVVKL
nr:hypothetical protein [Tanacetum cinerariifolium]